MTMAAIGATTPPPPKMTSKSFSIYGAQIKARPARARPRRPAARVAVTLNP